jgi:DNA-binding NarL/FixJ family response regulator
MIRVLLADDHGVIRDGLGRLIASLEDIELVGTAADGVEAVERAAELAPDVVVMDLDMPRLDGIEATRRVLADHPTTAVLVLTSFSDRSRILGAIEAGACGYLLKDVAADEVAEGIRAAARGESPIDPRAARTILTAQAQPDPGARLSPREGGARAARRGTAEQADRSAAGDQREDGQDAPDLDLPGARRDRPHPGGAVGAAQRLHGAAGRMTRGRLRLRRKSHCGRGARAPR